MVLSSDDWPRFSLLAGASQTNERSATTSASPCHLRPSSAQTARELLDAACDTSSTWECWLQLRVPTKRRRVSLSRLSKSDSNGVRAVCWIVHTPTWSCGVDSDGACVALVGSTWATSATATSCESSCPETTFRLQAGRWHHFAVVRSSAHHGLELFIDGRKVLMSSCDRTADQFSYCNSEAAGVLIGIIAAPQASDCVACALHDFRIWRCALNKDILTTWLRQPLSSAHPHIKNLVAHWGFSSCSSSEYELDLSGSNRHLRIVRPEGSAAAHNRWLRIASPRLAAAPTDFIIEALQDASENDSECRFQIKIRHRGLLECDTVLSVPVQQPRILFVCNFRCFKSTSVMNKGEGKWLVSLLQERVRSLPESALVGIYIPSTVEQAKHPSELVHLPVSMNRSGKSQTCKALEQLTITTTLSDVESLLHSIASGIRTFLIESAELLHTMATSSESSTSGIGLSHTSIIVVNDCVLTGTAAANPEIYDQARQKLAASLAATNKERMHIYFLHLRSPPPALSSVALNASRLFTEYVSCEQDFEWVLASVMHRISHVACTSARLHFQVFGDHDGSAKLTLDSLASGCVDLEQDSSSKEIADSVQIVEFGLCARAETLVLSGSFTASTKRSVPFVELTFQYLSHDKQLQAARTSLRLRDDLTNDMHVARMERNESLALLRGDSNLLLEQRRQLMDEKEQFLHAQVIREVGELENSFKRINIMKEELWAKRKWIIQRGLRQFEEDELSRLEVDAREAVATFATRLKTLQTLYTSNARENSRGIGGATGGRDISQRVQVELYTDDMRRHSSAGNGDDAEDGDSQDEFVQRFEKLAVKVDLLSTRFRDLESRMEDMLHSVRVSQSKGFVIMNDTRKVWMVMYDDLMVSKRKVMETTHERISAEFALAFQEHRQTSSDQMLSEIKTVNSALLKYEKEYMKRKKHVFFCMKEVIGAVEREAEAAFELDSATRAARQCKLLRSPPLDDPALYGSCVHVFFPLDISQQNGSPSSGSGEDGNRLNSTVHSLLFGLRHFCHEAVQAPFCRRIALQKNFLWLDQEQLDASPNTDCSDRDADAELLSIARQREQVHERSWAVIIVTYNALFESSAAVGELKRVLLFAEQKQKQVLHIELETPLTSLDAFKSSRIAGVENSKPTQQHHEAPVEKQYLLYKQSLGAFQAALVRIRSIFPSDPSGSLAIAPFKRECARCSRNGERAESAMLPCVPCCWPVLAQSTHSFEDPSAYSLKQPDYEFLVAVSSVGQWIDALALSATIASTTVRSHNIDPRGASPLFLKLERFWSEEVRRCDALWEESFSRRKAEIHRQLQKLFAAYDEEANALVQLQFMLTKRKQSLIAACLERVHGFQEELKLLRTLAELKESEELTEPAVQTAELALMMELDVIEMLSESDQLMMKLDQLEEAYDGESETESNQTLFLQVKQSFHESLKRSSQRILELGKQRVENQLRAITKHFGKQQERDEMQQLESQCAFEQSEIKRIEAVFSQGLDILSRRIADCKHELVDEARAFVQVSCLEQRKFSLTVGGCDLIQLHKYARDVDEQSKLRVAVLFDKLLSELMVDTAQAFRDKAEHAVQVFVLFYNPSPSPSLTEHERGDMIESPQSASIPPEVLRLKYFCSLNLGDPRETWQSLQRMAIVAEHELLRVRQAKHLACDFKMRFQEEFVGTQLERSRVYSRRYVEHLTDLLADVKNDKDQSLAKRLQCKRLLRTTIEDREQCKQRAVALQAKLADAKRRNLYLLQILQQCRASYEKAIHMSELLENFKMDPLFKSWFAVGEFHTSSVADWYELRAQCADDVARLEAELKVLERQLERLHKSVEQRRLQWVKANVEDVAICERAEQLQDLVHRAVDQIVETEEARVFHLLSCFDVRRKWLDEVRLKRLHVETTSSSPSTDDAGGAVNQNLVMLSIARLDSIKQEKLFDSLVRKLHVYERIRKQESEKQQMVCDEVRQHRALSDRLLQRVGFVTQQLARTQAVSKKSEHAAHDSNSGSKRDIISDDSTQVLAAQKEFETLKVVASRDHLFSEAHLCQLCWRLQEQIATSHRIDTVIQRLTGEIKVAGDYLGILKTTDNVLYNQGIKYDRGDDSEVRSESYGQRIRSHLPFVLRVFDYYTRQRWSVQSLERTTLINEKLRVCKERLVSLNSKPGSSPSNRSGAGAREDGDAGADSELMDEEVEAQLRESLASDVVDGELALLVNRFECRVAEHTSEALWDRLDTLAELVFKSPPSASSKDISGEYESSLPVDSSQTSSTSELLAVHSVVSQKELSSWLFSRDLCQTQKTKALGLLCKVTTDADARDVGGNIAEVVYGASLDSNEIKQMYLTKAKHHTEEQWRITCLVVLFFARIFRRAALQKAAKQRKLEAAVLTSTALQQQRELYNFAQALQVQLAASRTTSTGVFNWGPLTQQMQQVAKGRPKEWRQRLKNCFRLLQLEHEEHGIANIVMQIRDGLILARPLQHALGDLYDLNHEVRNLALRFEHVRAEFEHQPPTPSGLELVAAENNAIKIRWTPLQNDADLLYAAEIQRWAPLTKLRRSDRVEGQDNGYGGDTQDIDGGGSPTMYWDLFVSDSKQSHTFYKLQTGETYCIRVRSGVSRSKWGKASRAMFVKLQQQQQTGMKMRKAKQQTV